MEREERSKKDRGIAGDVSEGREKGKGEGKREKPLTDTACKACTAGKGRKK